MCCPVLFLLSFWVCLIFLLVCLVADRMYKEQEEVEVLNSIVVLFLAVETNEKLN